MLALLPILALINEAWYSLPLVVVISIVYSATRYEHPDDILIGTLRSAVWVVGFMAIIFGVLWLAGWGL